MVGVNVTVAENPAEIPFQVTGVVGIAGAVRANCILRCSQASTIKLAAQMLGIAADSPDSQKAAFDAFGEICNMVARYFKAKVGLGNACMLSVPTIITGQGYRFHSPIVYDRIDLAVAFEEETFSATLEIAR
jgi:CheY-specific phosphatase CheX